MSQFDERERGEERKYALDQESEFKMMARRNKLLGLWAADLLGLTGEEADTYAKSVVIADFEEAGEDDVFRKVRADFDAKGIDRNDQDIRDQMRMLRAVAHDQIVAERNAG